MFFRSMYNFYLHSDLFFFFKSLLRLMWRSLLFVFFWVFKSLIHFELIFVYDDPVSFFNTWLSNFSNIIYWKDCSFPIVYSWFFCCKLINHICVGLFLEFLFCSLLSTDLFSSIQLLSCVWLFVTPMDCSTPGLPVHH